MAPAIVRLGILMPVKRVWVPEGIEVTYSQALYDMNRAYLSNLAASMRAIKEIVAADIARLGVYNPYTMQASQPRPPTSGYSSVAERVSWAHEAESSILSTQTTRTTT